MKKRYVTHRVSHCGQQGWMVWDKLEGLVFGTFRLNRAECLDIAKEMNESV